MSGRQAKKERGPKIRQELAQQWMAFRTMYLPMAIGVEELKAYRNTFMAGAAAALRRTREALEYDVDNGFKGDSALVAELNRQTAELNKHQDAANLETGIHTVLALRGRRD